MNEEQQNASSPGDLSVNIAMSGYDNNNVVHAISVCQSLQCWVVIREHGDFINIGNAVSSPVPKCSIPSNVGGVDQIVALRNTLQEWLNVLLAIPEARESSAVQHFLCHDANIMRPQHEGLAWVTFSQIPTSTPHTQSTSPKSYNTRNTNGGRNSSLDEMEMDEMFGYYEDDENDQHDDDHESENTYIDESTYDEDQLAYSASERYIRTDEAITMEDAMQIQQDVNEIEMVEDVASLAHSLGASHVGRLQEGFLHKDIYPQNQPGHVTNELKEKKIATEIPTSRQSNEDKIQVNNNGRMISGGGIGDIVEKARKNDGGGPIGDEGSDDFTRRSKVSAHRLDSFKMIKVIGKGSFGKVFLVKEKNTEEVFALKVLKKDNIIKRNQVEHTRTERSVLGYIKHPFIVGLNMAFQSKEKLYFVLDYCAGGELFFHLGKLGQFPESRACFYTSEIILALNYVHNLDIIYRDLKPENVLLDARGHIRLTDFGLSKEGISSSSSGAFSFCGTPEYLAPEILNRQGHGRAVDWWSLGALLYEMLTGLPPFYCKDREKLFEKIRKSELTYPRSLSPGAVSLLKGLLTRNPIHRLGSGPTDAEEIKSHHFFSDISWEKLGTGDVIPPWDPQISGSLDTSQFDREFTSMPIFSPASMQLRGGFGALSVPNDNMFEGFSFTEKTFRHLES